MGKRICSVLGQMPRRGYLKRRFTLKDVLVGNHGRVSRRVSLSCCHHSRSRDEAALAAVCRRLGFDVSAAAITTPRASTRTSSQTFCRGFRWVRLAHPNLLLDLMRMNCVSCSWRVSGCWSRHAPGWGGPAPTWMTILHHRIVRRGWAAHWSACRAERVTREWSSTHAHLVETGCGQ
jgi:hypothetical protein